MIVDDLDPAAARPTPRTATASWGKEGFMPESLLTETDISKHLRVSVACVRRWRLERRGPRFLKIGSLVRYKPEDVEEWINGRPTGGEGLSANSPIAASAASHI